jgi:hypothetical protein
MQDRGTHARLAVDAGHIQWQGPAHRQEEVVAHGAPRARHAVDHGEATLQLSGVAHAPIDVEAVLNHERGRAPVVPQEAVVVGDVDQQHPWVIDRMSGLDRMRSGDVVLEVDWRPIVASLSSRFDVFVFEILVHDLEANRCVES